MNHKQLLILRHGKSDWSTGLADFDRPLVGRGRKGARKMGAWMRHLDLVPDVVISSPAARARATAEEACKAMGLPAGNIVWDERIYEAPGTQILAALADAPAKANRLLLVGHNPGLEELIHLLVGDPPTIPADGKLMPTAALARLEIAGEWRDIGPGSAHLLSVTRPGEVADDSSTWATSPRRSATDPVPAHFFTQSAVIPWRRHDGRLEFLLVKSRSGKRWGIPKGVKEPELDAAESAAREALAQAGVHGKVDPEPLGSYAYDKWGGTCTVTVYGMAVSECLPESGRAESHRKRRWFPAAAAVERLEEPRLRALLGCLAARLDGD